MQTSQFPQTGQSAPNIRQKLDMLQTQYHLINQDITQNLKTFDQIVTQDKQAYDKIKRNLQDIKTIFINDLDKFEETVDKSIQYNEALYVRLEKDVYYLRDDQDNVRRKMLVLEKRIQEMEEQIGHGA